MVEVVYAEELAAYRLSPDHPLRPERFVLTMALAGEWGLLAERTPAPGRAAVVLPEPASDPELERAHDREYIDAVKLAGNAPELWRGAFGIGPGDTPAFANMHEAAALAAGATLRGMRDVLGGAALRAFCPAGGLHHAHRGYASGFCVYNDLVVAIADALGSRPGIRVAYIDVDVHHGDGVQDAFYESSDVLTVSVHESGRYLFPGTGLTTETGRGAGTGYAVNVPLPPYAGDESYALAFERVIAPAVRAYAPDVIVAQLGADSHRNDPLAHLETTVAGQYATSRRVVSLADEVCGGVLVATGGGGYDTFSAVPRAWACALAALLGVEPPEELPEAWRELARELQGDGTVPPARTFEESVSEEGRWNADALVETEQVIERLEATHPLLGGSGPG